MDVPTLDEEVCKALEALGQATNRTDGDPAGRRQKLAELMEDPENHRTVVEVLQSGDTEMLDDDGEGVDEEEEFFTPGTDELFRARVAIADDSLARASKRVAAQRQRYLHWDRAEGLRERREEYGRLSKMEPVGSQMVSSRFTSACCFAPDGRTVACGSWDGSLYLFDRETLERKRTYKDLHTEKLSGIDWAGDLIATGGGDGRVKIVRGDNTDTMETGHLNRVTALQILPSGQYLASASHDTTWRLWDVLTKRELYYQEGHSMGLTALRVHPDGSLLASAGLDAIARVWDLRTGRSIATLEKNGHVRAIHAMDWRPSGSQLLTGGADNNIKVWDLRKSETALATIAAHTKVVTSIRVSADDRFVCSTGYDGKLVVSACDSWATLKRLQAIDKLMCCDIDSECEGIVAGGWDRSVKLYGNSQGR